MFLQDCTVHNLVVLPEAIKPGGVVVWPYEWLVLHYDIAGRTDIAVPVLLLVHRDPQYVCNIRGRREIATLCDLQRAVTTPRFGLRYSKTKEVAELRSKIERCRFTARDLVYSHPNIILSEMFMSLPPLFENEEFLSLSLSSPHELVVSYLVSSIESLPLVKRQRVFLLCSSLRNLLEFTSHRGQSLTDVLMLFTPVVFPRCTLTTEGFLRASRALLIMIEENRLVFGKGFVRQSEEDFLRDLLSSIEGMQLCSYEPDDQTDSDDSGVGLGEDTPATCLQLSDSQYYYTLAYFD
ncbi:hypothetical protein Q1695_010228 [Nippostrongylus brasiliensis]|nr:hypothetical protein Q1695_010228 [Nippostrongylus brasiliensis]